MDMIQTVILGVAGIGFLLFLRHTLRRMNRESDIRRLYRDILVSDEYKVKGKFD